MKLLYIICFQKEYFRFPSIFWDDLFFVLFWLLGGGLFLQKNWTGLSDIWLRQVDPSPTFYLYKVSYVSSIWLSIWERTNIYSVFLTLKCIAGCKWEGTFRTDHSLSNIFEVVSSVYLHPFGELRRYKVKGVDLLYLRWFVVDTIRWVPKDFRCTLFCTSRYIWQLTMRLH